MWDHVKLDLPSFGGGHDRAEIIVRGSRALLVVADGAGGMSGAHRAADLVVEVVDEVTRRHEGPMGPVGLCRLLERIDRLILSCWKAGQSTGVIVEVVEDRFWGASVGDSGAWLVHGGHHLDLTSRQHRKWRLGSGLARPVHFGPLPLCGTIVAATDGLFDCAPPDRITLSIGDDPLSGVLDALVEGVRLPDGGLRDDVALALLRPRRRYAIGARNAA